MTLQKCHICGIASDRKSLLRSGLRLVGSEVWDSAVTLLSSPDFLDWYHAIMRNGPFKVHISFQRWHWSTLLETVHK